MMFLESQVVFVVFLLSIVRDLLKKLLERWLPILHPTDNAYDQLNQNIGNHNPGAIKYIAKNTDSHLLIRIVKTINHP